MGNGQAKELICVTHEHELREVNAGWWEELQGKRGEKKCDNCNSIFNEIY